MKALHEKSALSVNKKSQQDWCKRKAPENGPGCSDAYMKWNAYFSTFSKKKKKGKNLNYVKGQLLHSFRRRE